MARSREERRERRRVSARRRVEAHKNEGTSRYLKLPEGVSFFKVDKPGVRVIDVMPYLTKVASKYADAGEAYFEKTFFFHRDIGPNKEMVVCPARTANKPCPICDYRSKLVKDPEADEDVIKALAPKERQLWLVRDRQAPDNGLMVWDVSPYLFGNLLESRIDNADEDEDWDAFADLEEGCSLRLTFQEKQFSGSKFFECTSIDFKSRREQYSDSDIEDHPCLDDLLIVKSYDELKKMFLQVASAEEEDDEDEESAPKKSSKKPAKSQKEDDWDDEAEHEPAPKKSSKRVSEPELEDEDDWDDEEDMPPQKKSGGRTSKATKPSPVTEDDWDEEEQPPKKLSKKPVKRVTVEEEDDEDDWEDVEEPAPKKTKTGSSTKRREDDEDEESAPKKSSKKPAKSQKEDDWDDDWD